MENSRESWSEPPVEVSPVREFILKADDGDFVLEPEIHSMNDFLDIQLNEVAVKGEPLNANSHGETWSESAVEGSPVCEFILKAKSGGDFVLEPEIHSMNDFLDIQLNEVAVKGEPLIANSDGSRVVVTSSCTSDAEIGPKNVFSVSCGVCSFQGTDPLSLVNHMKTHKFKTHVCCICGVVLSSAAELGCHLVTHKKEVPHVCSYCHHGFFRLTSLQTHDCKKRPKSCQHCGEQFRFKKSLKLHIKEKHQEEVPKKRHCPHCDFSGWSGAVLNDHLRTHRNNKFLQCPHCTFQFSKVESLQTHLRIHKDEPSFVCPYCGIVFAKYGVVKLHMEIHKNRKVLQCRHCDYQSPSPQNLRVHNVRNHRNKTYGCPHCEYTTSVEIRYKMHILIHESDAKPHACSSCDYKTNYLWDLKRHVQSRHEKQPSYPCPHCDFAAATLCVLKNHALKHTVKLPPPDFLKIA